MPEVDVVNGGLEILKTVDLRQPLQNVPMPFLRLYGYLDGLVPRKVVPMLDKLWPHSESYIFAKIVWLSRRSGAAQSGADAG